MDNEEFYKLSLVATTFEVSEYAVFWASYKHSGYIISDAFLEDKFGNYLRTQEIPIHVLRYCDKVLKGKVPLLLNNGKSYMLC